MAPKFWNSLLRETHLFSSVVIFHQSVKTFLVMFLCLCTGFSSVFNCFNYMCVWLQGVCVLISIVIKCDFVMYIFSLLAALVAIVRVER